jgi:cephalosporin hydroxylase
VKPDLVIETGVARGGSVIFYASMMKLLGNGGRVVGVDIDIRPHNRESIVSHPLSNCIELIEGSSTDGAVLSQVERHVRAAACPLVVLDSGHTHDHVLRELELYSPFVRAGSYLVVLDTGVELLPPEMIVDRPWGPGNSPMKAVEAFLAKSARFEVDREMDAKLLISCAPSGYLKCVRD